MWIDADGWAPPLEDPAASRIVGKVGYTVVPAGPKGQYLVDLWRRHRHRGGEQEQGSRLSAVPVGGLEDARRAAAAGRRRRAVPQLDRSTTPKSRKGVKQQEWLKSVINSAKICKLGLPVVIPVAEFRDLVGAALTATLSGGDPAAELKKAHEQFRPILERSEKA